MEACIDAARARADALRARVLEKHEAIGKARMLPDLLNALRAFGDAYKEWRRAVEACGDADPGEDPYGIEAAIEQVGRAANLEELKSALRAFAATVTRARDALGQGTCCQRQCGEEA